MTQRPDGVTAGVRPDTRGTSVTKVSHTLTTNVLIQNDRAFIPSPTSIHSVLCRHSAPWHFAAMIEITHIMHVIAQSSREGTLEITFLNSFYSFIFMSNLD